MVGFFERGLSLAFRLPGASTEALPTGLQAGPLPSPTLVQAGSTVVLAVITAWYALQTRRSTDLARRRMAVEARRRHAATLQERTGAWLEDFPEVGPTRVRLPDGARGADDGVRLSPASLANDPYFEDFLENHAADVADLTAEVADEVEAFRRKRAAFVERTDLQLDGERWSLVEPGFYEWLFERVVLLERGIADEAALKADLREAFTDPRVEGSSTVFPGDTHPARRRDVLVFHRTRSTAQDRDDERWHRLSANRIVDVVDSLDQLAEHSTAVEAAELLDEIEADVAELERRVVEYHEMDRLPGDCEYAAENPAT